MPYVGTLAAMESLNFTRLGDDWKRWFTTDANGLKQVRSVLFLSICRYRRARSRAGGTGQHIIFDVAGGLLFSLVCQYRLSITHNPQVAGYQRVWDSPSITPGSSLFAYAVSATTGPVCSPTP